MKHEVRKTCCVCKKDLGPADWKADEPGLKTHTYCAECAEKEVAAFEGISIMDNLTPKEQTCLFCSNEFCQCRDCKNRPIYERKTNCSLLDDCLYDRSRTCCTAFKPNRIY